MATNNLNINHNQIQAYIFCLLKLTHMKIYFVSWSKKGDGTKLTLLICIYKYNEYAYVELYTVTGVGDVARW